MGDYPNQPKWKFTAEIFGFVNTLRRGPEEPVYRCKINFAKSWEFSRKTKESSKRSCNRFINFRQHDRAFLVPDFLTKLPVKPPYMAMGPCTAKFVYITAMQFHTSWVCVKEGWIVRKARHSIFESFDNGVESIKMSFFPRIRMLLPAVHRIR